MEIRPCTYGAPAHDELEALVRAHQGDDRLRPVTVVVPTNAVGVALRRRLARGADGAGIAAVGVLTHHRLAELLASTHLPPGGRPLTGPVLGAAIRSVLSSDPGAFAPVADHPSTAEALVRAHRTLAELWAGTDGALPDPVRALRDSRRRLTREVVRVHLAARQALRPAWYDQADLVDAARSAVAGSAALLADLGLVVVFLPQELSPGQAALLAGLAARTSVVVMVGLTGHPDADRPVLASLERLGQPLPSCPPAAGLLGRASCRPQDTVVFSASDADDEVRHAVRHLGAAMARGVALERMALLYGASEPYAALAQEHLAAAGMVCNGAAARPLRDRLLARAVLRLLALPDQDFRNRDVCGWLADAPVLDGDGQRVRASAFATLARTAGVVSGDDWDARLGRFIDDERRGCAERHPDDPGASSRWWKVEQGEALRHFVAGLRRDLAGDPGGWAARVDWVRRLIRRYLGGDGYRHARWRPAEAAAADKVEAALDRLAELDPVEPSPSLATFRTALDLELDADLGRTGKLGQGVLVGPVSSALGLDLDLVVITGLAEGSYPSLVREDPLLPGDELAEAGTALPSAADRLSGQHRNFLAALAGARCRVVGAPRGDLRKTTQRVPSRWLLDVAAELIGSPVRLASNGLDACRPHPWMQVVASFAGGIAGLQAVGGRTEVETEPVGQLTLELGSDRQLPPVTEQELRLAALPARGRSRLQRVVAAADPVLGAGLRLQAARDSDRFTEYDGNLAGLAVPRPSDGGVVSPTQLEEWAKCPFKYFMHRVLGVQERDDPEDVLELSPMDKGTLIHLALELFLLDVLGRPEHAQPHPDRPWTDADEAAMRTAFRQACEQFAAAHRVGPALLWTREQRRAQAEVLRFLDHDHERRQTNRARPAAAELRFGFDDADIGLVTLDLDDGRTVSFRGSIDRVDRGDDGSLYVVDYKTGKSKAFKAITQEDPTATASKLQLPVYALAAQRWATGGGLGDSAGGGVRSEYWFTAARDNVELIGIDVDKAVIDRFTEVVAGIDDQIGAGTFPARAVEGWPGKTWVDCPYCDPDGLGTDELRRGWERKHHDRALVPYRALVEPEEGDVDV